MGALYFGDNLDILREHIRDESIDLVYLDPPFNSKRDYNLLFKTPKGHDSDAQITAFDDTWHWAGGQAARELYEIQHQPNTDVSEIMTALHRFLKESDMMAYLVMMANRLLELRRVLKPTGSLYLHCDPTASHYLKIVLDAVFGAENFRNEIVWKRTSSHGNVSRGFGNVTDTIFYYSKSEKFIWNQVYIPYSPDHINSNFNKVDENGRRFTTSDLRNPSYRPNLIYDFAAKNGITYKPHQNGWAVSKDVMKKYDQKDLLYYPSSADGRLRLKRYLDEAPGERAQNLWDDISPISAQAAERMGYPTQKPVALLERIIQASSNEGDVVLDPFCGCGTAVHAAQKLGREWVGIDITHLAIGLIEKRMKDAFPGIQFEIHGTPKDLEGARELFKRNPYQFQWWACSLVNAQPYQGRKKGADGGVDGLLFFQDDEGAAKKIIVSVKGGANVGVTMLKDLVTTVENEKAQIGLFITLAEPTKPMLAQAASAGFYESARMGQFPKIQVLTIAEILSGKKPLYPDFARGGLNFKKARVEKQKGGQGKLL